MLREHLAKVNGEQKQVSMKRGKLIDKLASLLGKRKGDKRILIPF